MRGFIKRRLIAGETTEKGPLTKVDFETHMRQLIVAIERGMSEEEYVKDAIDSTHRAWLRETYGAAKQMARGFYINGLKAADVFAALEGPADAADDLVEGGDGEQAP